VEAVMITGSPAGVYDDEAWIGPLADFIRAGAAAGVPQVGICFGHQILAEALGGKVIKSDKGWGVGRHTYDVVACPGFVSETCPPTVSAAVSHQDQVVALPPGAEVIAASDFTPLPGSTIRTRRRSASSAIRSLKTLFCGALFPAPSAARRNLSGPGAGIP
jgi:GMP synthase-like glutamine amidotransferase